MNRCHLPQCAPELPQRGRYLTVVGLRSKSRARFVPAEGVKPAPASRKEICGHPSDDPCWVGFPANNPPKRAVSRLVGTVAPRLGEQLCCLINAPDSLGKS
jgi:hypothetical protein